MFKNMRYFNTNLDIPMAQRKIFTLTLGIYGLLVWSFMFPGFTAIAPWYIYVLAIPFIGLLWYFMHSVLQTNYKGQLWYKLFLVVIIPRRFYMEINPRDWETVEFVLSKWALIDTNRNVVIFLRSRDAVTAKLMRMSK